MHKEVTLKKEMVVTDTMLKRDAGWPGFWSGKGYGMYGHSAKGIMATSYGAAYSETCIDPDRKECGFVITVELTKEGKSNFFVFNPNHIEYTIDKRYMKKVISDIKESMKADEFKQFAKELDELVGTAEKGMNEYLKPYLQP